MRNYRKFYCLNGTTYKVMDEPVYECIDEEIFAKALAVNSSRPHKLFILVWRVGWQQCQLENDRAIFTIKPPRFWIRKPDAAIELQ